MTEATSSPLQDDESPEHRGDPNFMSSLARGLTVIQAFSSHRRLMSISQISQKTGIPRAAVRRCLYTLSQLGFVGSEDGRSFYLRPRILSLSHNYLASTPLAKASLPVLRHVSQLLQESSSIAVLDGDEILYIARASTTRIMTVDLDIGSRLPAMYTSMGRVLIAHLPEDEREAYLDRTKIIQYTPHTLTTKEDLRMELAAIREQGFAIIDQELELALRSVALPIMGVDQRPVAALNAGLHAVRASIPEIKKRILPVLQEAVSELSLLLD